MHYSLRNDLILACWRKRRVGLGGGWFGGKHCWGQMWKRWPCDLASSSPLLPSCFQPASRHATSPQLPPDWLNSTLLPSHWLEEVITALPLYGYCTASNKRDDWKRWLRKFAGEKGHTSCPRNWASLWPKWLWNHRILRPSLEFAHSVSPLSHKRDYVWCHELFPLPWLTFFAPEIDLWGF